MTIVGTNFAPGGAVGGIINMASELVSAATSDKLTEMDWTKNIEICELVARDHRQAKDVVKAIKKRLGSKSSNTQLYAVLLLEMLMNNIGEPVHKQVIDTGVLPILVKIVKKKSDLPVREKIFLLLDAAQTSVGGATGRFPNIILHIMNWWWSAGVQFPQRPHDTPKPDSTSHTNVNSIPGKESTTLQCERNPPEAQSQKVSDSSILQKAGTALEVLRDVLNTIDTQHPEGAKDEFTLDLVEQCSFQKQRVMHLAVTSRDEKVVSRAIELNERLERVLRHHDALLAGKTMSTSNHINHEQEEEEEEEQLFRRRNVASATHTATNRGAPTRAYTTIKYGAKQEPIRPLTLELNQPANTAKPAVAIPPPPAKHVEREKFFQENKADASTLNGHMRGLSLHSRNASSSRSGSIDFSD
ncbi:UNVERIFIED_CONTAM: TOM1-like protein 5 [Sesamum calycinum]|uniref:TOM1-like protein 5 n=1 Tax=Sesamum calycinum TaxID=2727403 RepID=A0AAW2MN40_9LAMI